jgi:tellurite resistance protein
MITWPPPFDDGALRRRSGVETTLRRAPLGASVGETGPEAAVLVVLEGAFSSSADGCWVESVEAPAISGLDACLAREPWTLERRATEPMLYATVSRQAFEWAVADHPNVASRLARLVAREACALRGRETARARGSDARTRRGPVDGMDVAIAPWRSIDDLGGLAMRRLLIDPEVCTEVMALLVAVAWADDELQEEEKQGLRAACDSLNIPKALRPRLESFIADARPVADLEFGAFETRDRAFAFVAAAWMAHLHGGIDEREGALLGEIADALDIDPARQTELRAVATAIEPPPEGARWSNTIVQLFRSIADEV